MYTDLETARMEIKDRWQDEKLRREVLEFCGDIPQVMQSVPRAIIARQVAKPDFESLRFWKLASGNGLVPTWMEFSDDCFCTSNPHKLSLGKVVFFHGTGRRGGIKTSTKKVIDFIASEGKPISRICTRRGKNLASVHRELLLKEIPEAEVYNLSEWLMRVGGKSSLYYPKYLAAFVCFGVLFENFLDYGKEGLFTDKIVQPAFKAVVEKFGRKPLIVPILSKEEEKEETWNWYPGHLEPFFEG